MTVFSKNPRAMRNWCDMMEEEEKKKKVEKDRESRFKTCNHKSTKSGFKPSNFKMGAEPAGAKNCRGCHETNCTCCWHGRNCKMMPSCSFFHPEEDFVSREDKEEEKEECYFFQHGGCHFGDNCNKEHMHKPYCNGCGGKHFCRSKLCWHWLNFGKCSRHEQGECNFNHDPKHQKVCKHHKAGWCKYGNKCRYYHP